MTEANNVAAEAQVQAPVQTKEVVGVKKSVKRAALEVSRVYKSDWQKEGSLTAELKQKHITTSSYPSKRVENNMQDNIFATEEFGYEDTNFSNEKTLVAWIDVPENSTVESVVAKLASFPEASIYRVISNFPILHSGQVSQINRLITEGKQAEALDLKNSIANRQVIVYGQDTEDGLHKAGELILDSLGKPQFKADYFSTTLREDIDDKDNKPDSFYVTPEIKTKMQETTIVEHPDQTI